eukprot:2818638-Rhodomonas_salina.1
MFNKEPQCSTSNRNVQHRTAMSDTKPASSAHALTCGGSRRGPGTTGPRSIPGISAQIPAPQTQTQESAFSVQNAVSCV